jgi:hypothetical protein
MTQNLIITDGIKSANLQNPEAFARWLNPDEAAPITKLYASVAMLNRCIHLRTDAAAHMPFALRKGKADVTTSDDWQDPKGILPSPRRLLRQLEGSMLFANAAYAWKRPNEYRITKGLQFFAPTVTTPQFEPMTGELLHFQRADRNYQPDEVMYVFYQDGVTEYGPSAATVVGAAASAAGVLHYLDLFAQGYFKRGAIKITLLGLPPGTSRETGKEIESLFQRALVGVKHAFGIKAFNAGVITPTVIGDGIEALANNTLTVQEREDIATAFGVPMSMVMSNAANFATASQDERNLIQWAVLPDCELIAEALTEQVYSKWGYTFEFRPETMDSFQEDEVNRAGAYSQYVSAGMKPSVAAQIVGIELPADIEYEDLDPEEPEPVPADLAQFAGQENQPAEPMPDEDEEEKPAPKSLTVEQFKELEIWQRKAQKAKKGGLNANVEFTIVSIPPDMAAAIRGRLDGAKTTEEIRAAFQVEPAANVSNSIDLAAELKRANDLLERLNAAA